MKGLVLSTTAIAVAISFFLAGVEGLSVTTQENEIGSEEEPIEEEDGRFELKCDIQLNDHEEWTLCQWSHVIEDEYDDDDEELRVLCTADDDLDSGKICNNRGGNVESDYYDRIRMNVGPTTCGISVSEAHPWDNGRWECHVSESGSTTQQIASVDVFVSNRSTVFITEPDLYDDDSQVVVYDMSESRPEIEIECSAFGGRPEPTFRWFIDDDGNEIEVDSEDNLSLSPIKQGPSSHEWGPSVSQTLSWSPTIEALCEYGLDEMVCEKNKRKYREFSFNIYCKADQGSYYDIENENEWADVIVEVSGATRHAGAAGSAAVVLAAAAAFVTAY